MEVCNHGELQVLDEYLVQVLSGIKFHLKYSSLKKKFRDSIWYPSLLANTHTNETELEDRRIKNGIFCI